MRCQTSAFSQHFPPPPKTHQGTVQKKNSKPIYVLIDIIPGQTWLLDRAEKTVDVLKTTQIQSINNFIICGLDKLDFLYNEVEKLFGCKLPVFLNLVILFLQEALYTADYLLHQAKPNTCCISQAVEKNERFLMCHHICNPTLNCQ